MQLKSYERKVLYSSHYFEVVSITWPKGHLSPLHNHGWSQCLVQIEEGQFENILDLGNKTEIQMLEKGQTLCTPVGAKHEIKCLSEFGQTLHVYVPRIEAHEDVGQFAVAKSALSELSKELELGLGVRIDRVREGLELIRKNSISTNSPFFMNQLFSGVTPQSVMAEEVVAQTKTTLATLEASPALSAVEAETIGRLGELLGWSYEGTEGVTVPGGSAANFMALHLARHNAFPEAKLNGLGNKRVKIYVSADAHYSFKKAAMALGLGLASVTAISVDEQGRLKTADLAKQIQVDLANGEHPLMAVATAGTTVFGAFDPISEISEICKTHKVWLHVDGAWGGPAVFSERLRHLVNGIEQADSVALDAHKLLGASLTCSFILTRHKGLLLAANDVSGADYLFHTADNSNLDRGRLSWQCGRGADVLSFWAIWKNLGTRELGAFIDRQMEVRAATQKWIALQPRLEMMHEPQFLNLCVKVLPPEGTGDPLRWSRQVREKLIQDNAAMINFSSLGEQTFLRLIFANPHLRFEHVQQMLEAALALKPENI